MENNSFITLIYLIKFVNNNPYYYRFFKNSFIPDEIFFNTIIMNSPFKFNVENNLLRYVDWERGPEFPRSLRIEDYDRIVDSNMMMARKFDKDDAILDRIDEYRRKRNTIGI